MVLKTRGAFLLKTDTLKTGSIESGRINLQPTSTRFARVATFILHPEKDQSVGSTAWMDASDSRGLSLVYFDRPCSAIGSVVEEGREYRYNITVAEAGFVWLRLKKVSETVWETTASAPPTDLRLTVAPLENTP